MSGSPRARRNRGIRVCRALVTLARTPHLDGEYAWVGHAEGDWSAVAEGDIVAAVHVDE